MGHCHGQAAFPTPRRSLGRSRSESEGLQHPVVAQHLFREGRNSDPSRKLRDGKAATHRATALCSLKSLRYILTEESVGSMAVPPTVGFWFHSSGYWISTLTSVSPRVPHHGLLCSSQVTSCDGLGGE